MNQQGLVCVPRYTCYMIRVASHLLGYYYISTPCCHGGVPSYYSQLMASYPASKGGLFDHIIR